MQVAPTSIHPAFEKAAHYFDLIMKHVPVDPETLVCDLEKYEEAIDSNTILLLASAPAYPQVCMLLNRAPRKYIFIFHLGMQEMFFVYWGW